MIRLNNKKQMLFPILSVHIIVFIVVFVFMCSVLGNFSQHIMIDLHIMLDFSQYSLLITAIICFPHTVTCCLLGNILQTISKKRIFYYFMLNSAIFFTCYLCALSIWKSIPYSLNTPIQVWMGPAPKYFTAWDSLYNFLHYAVLQNLLFASVGSIIFTTLVLIMAVICLAKRRLSQKKLTSL